MRKTLFTTFALALTLAATVGGTAHADAVSDRVYLSADWVGPCGTGETGYTTRAFRRILQKPDGTEVRESGEFTVPGGYYLEITSVEYLTARITQQDYFFVRPLDLTIRPRSATWGGTSVMAAKYQNRKMYGDNGSALVAIGQYVSPGQELQVVHFPVGPIMDSNARLCMRAPTEYWNDGVGSGAVRVRGRLIPGTAVSPDNGGTGGGLLSP